VSDIRDDDKKVGGIGLVPLATLGALILQIIVFAYCAVIWKAEIDYHNKDVDQELAVHDSRLNHLEVNERENDKAMVGIVHDVASVLAIVRRIEDKWISGDPPTTGSVKRP
jgi:hypothetical protein